MKLKTDRKISAIERYWGVINNGLFFYGLRNRLAKIGIDISPYYWVQEEFEPCDEPQVKGGSSDYVLRNLSLQELDIIRSHESDKDFEVMKNGIKNGQLCFALECNGEIAAYTFIELNDFEFKGKDFKLKPNEAFLLNMWTFHHYRGRNLAPYLRYKSYELLKSKGIDTKYSITDFLNKSSIKFKKKLNSKNLNLYLNIELFRKYKWNFNLKKY